MRLGQRAMEALRAEVRGRLMEGDSLVVAGAVALQGTWLLVKNERDRLQKIFSEGFLYDAEKCPELSGIAYKGFLDETEPQKGASGGPSEKIFLERLGISPEVAGHCRAFYAMGTGGVLCAVWKMAEASGMGLEADLRKIPIRQETIEICECFDLDPYRLLSGGSVLLGTDRGREMVQLCRQKGIPAAVIGTAVKGSGRILRSGEITRYLDRPGQDEITKLPWGEKWKYFESFPGRERK